METDMVKGVPRVHLNLYIRWSDWFISCISACCIIGVLYLEDWKEANWDWDWDWNQALQGQDYRITIWHGTRFDGLKGHQGIWNGLRKTLWELRVSGK